MLARIIYWAAVLAVSIALVIALILWFESQDESRIEGTSAAPGISAEQARVGIEGQRPADVTRGGSTTA